MSNYKSHLHKAKKEDELRVIRARVRVFGVVEPEVRRGKFIREERCLAPSKTGIFGCFCIS
jgi:hypothetical protein